MLNSVIHVLKNLFKDLDNASLVLHEPLFKGNEWKYVKECLDTGWVSSVGKYVDKFEKDLTDFTEAKYAIATVNGTAALHISYLLAGIQPGDEVLVPTLTFVGTVNPLSYCGAIPHFIDAEEKYFGIDAEVLNAYLKDITKIENGICINKNTNRPIRALCIMHTLGHPVDIDAIEEVTKRYNLILLEDAAEGLGSFYKGKHVGHRGLLGALSFNGNKIITTGGGGAILTNDKELAKQAKHLTTTAKLPHAWEFEHDRIAYNYRLPNINAALGCAQLENLSEYLRIKRELAQQYKNAFKKLEGVHFVEEPPYAKSNYWLNAFLINQQINSERDDLLALLSQNNIFVRPFWNLQHTLPMYRNCPRMDLFVAENLYKRLIKLPSSVKLGIQNKEVSIA